MLPHFNQIFFVGPLSKKAMQLACLFDHISAVAVTTLVVVLYWAVVVLSTSVSGHMGYKEHKPLETAWTVIPMLMLLWIALPSLYLLYSHDETSKKVFTTIKVIGHQWYWEYEYSPWDVFHGNSFSFDSYMLRDPDLKLGQPRTLTVDKPMVLPYGVPVRVLTTSADVIHSWAVPSLGLKADALPGRLNQVVMCALKPGVVWGMCSEICGDGHAYMPIEIELITPEDFISWLQEAHRRSA
uniref:Cytochrome c oxidase subunit 2 n=1 Tax=Lottia digitalis TaxID=225159 RepID=Q2I6Y9_9GAST|nr:cytochrome c oxidase subunit II [Lottia digitalis]ABC00931.1 cytochrome c oxidase subunit II [Lottia digitalis]